MRIVRSTWSYRLAFALLAGGAFGATIFCFESTLAQTDSFTGFAASSVRQLGR